MSKRLLAVLFWFIGIVIAMSLLTLVTNFSVIPIISELNYPLPRKIISIIIVLLFFGTLVATGWYLIEHLLYSIYERIVATPKSTEDKKDEQPNPDPDRQVLTVFQNGTEIYSRTNVYYYENRPGPSEAAFFINP